MNTETLQQVFDTDNLGLLETCDYRIYVSCLAAYNNGYLHGEWIDATLEADEIEQRVQAMIKRSPACDAEEWAIHDYELGGVRIGEGESFETVADIGKLLSSGDYPEVVLSYVIGENSGESYDRIIEILEESYIGEYESAEDYACEFCKEVGEEIPKWLENYVDYSSMARDWEYSGDIQTLSNGYKSVYVLRRY